MSHNELWSQLKAGDKNALEKIYRTHVDLLFKYGCRFSTNTQLVEDCVQDLFMEIWRNRKGLSQTDSIKRYLLASIRRKIIKHLEKGKKLVSTEDHDPSFELEIAIEERLINAETKVAMSQQLKRAFDSLSKRQKEAVYLKYYAGLDYEDIENVMDIGYQSLRNLVSNALKKMKQNVGALEVIILMEYFFKFF